ncbi:hypothetical protein, partial [Pseudomonas proteolytica]|uniref:hypothetical protein n=1 Tax=Pseudomonas proteolytica TaxID=219574 RepID=UPI001F31F108
QHFHADHPVFSCSKSEQKQLNTWVSFQSAEQPLLGQFSVSGNKLANHLGIQGFARPVRASLYLEYRILLKIAVDECRYWRVSAAFQQHLPDVLTTEHQWDSVSPHRKCCCSICKQTNRLKKRTLDGGHEGRRVQLSYAG